MSKKNVYNQGVESGLKVATKIMEQEVEAMNYLKSKIDLIGDGQNEMSSAVYKLIENADENEIHKIFGICNPVRPVDLEDHEKKLLLNLIASLCKAGINNNQKLFYNNLRHHLNLPGYEPDGNCDYRSIESIETVRSIKVIAKAIRIFLFLAENNMDDVYAYEESIFSHFELRSFDEIDAVIEFLYCLFGEDGLIEIYGDYESEGEIKDLSYLHVEKKDNLKISNECAQIYFKDMYIADDSRKYIESASYVVYNDFKNIVGIHKTTGKRQIIFEASDSDEAKAIMKKRRIASYADIIYYAVGNDIYFYNLDTQKGGIIFSIEQIKDSDGKVYAISELFIYQSEKLIYKNGYRYYVKDLEDVSEATIKMDVSAEGRCFLHGDYLYYVDTANDIDDFLNEKELTIKYQIMKCSVHTGQSMNVSVAFGKHKMMDGIYQVYELESEGIFSHYYYVIYGYQSVTSTDRVGFKCSYFDINESGSAKEHNFFIWHSLVYQIEQYKDSLIYVDAGKGFALVRHTILDDKKKVLVKKYGTTEKASLSDKFYLGKGMFQKPERYMSLGCWLWIKEPGKRMGRVISI
ncbi:MAG: hypothetical protein LUH19_00655 [Lachnospiraceae bacterium]|nr:hypothetical protein [Lachnospiraceae bacterium]